jgi:WG containing repeat
MLKPIQSNIVASGYYRWGFQNDNNCFIIPPLFAEAHEFSEGLAAVKFICSWGYINEQGEVIISPMFDEASDFHEGFATVRVGSKYTFIDQTGKLITLPQFSQISNFVNGVAKVKIRGYEPGDIYRDYDASVNTCGQVFDQFYDSTDDIKVDNHYYERCEYEDTFPITI